MLHLEPDQLNKVDRLLEDMEQLKWQEEDQKRDAHFLNDYQRHLEANKRAERPYDDETKAKKASDYDPFCKPVIETKTKEEAKSETPPAESTWESLCEETPMETSTKFEAKLDSHRVSSIEMKKSSLIQVRERLPAFKLRAKLMTTIANNQVTVIRYGHWHNFSTNFDFYFFLNDTFMVAMSQSVSWSNPTQ